jgi:phospholipid/cholesterol/gamma-HCH transport system substrate-binding protein
MRARSPRAGCCRPRRSPTRSSSTRSCAPSIRRPARRSRTGCRPRRRRSAATARTSTTRSLQASFKALPTFEDESRKTFDRLTAFSENTDPLVNQLRPAARELSPTLEDLRDISPDLKNLLEELQPLIDASKRGFPAAEQVLEDTRPLLGQLDPATAQLTPAVDFIGQYKPELGSFFANSVAATQAKDPGTTLHYLRTVNPLNLENLAVYPRRLGTNRTNAYAKPGQFDHFMQGLLSYETRHCNRAVPLTITNQPPTAVPDTPVPVLDPLVNTITPAITQQIQQFVPQSLIDNLNKFVLSQVTANGGGAPRCVYQGDYNFSGEKTQYPHVKARGR